MLDYFANTPSLLLLKGYFQRGRSIHMVVAVVHNSTCHMRHRSLLETAAAAAALKGLGSILDTVSKGTEDTALSSILSVS